MIPGITNKKLHKVVHNNFHKELHIPIIHIFNPFIQSEKLEVSGCFTVSKKKKLVAISIIAPIKNKIIDTESLIISKDRLKL